MYSTCSFHLKQSAEILDKMICVVKNIDHFKLVCILSLDLPVDCRRGCILSVRQVISQSIELLFHTCEITANIHQWHMVMLGLI